MWTWFAAPYLHQRGLVFTVTEVQQAFSLQEESYHGWVAIGTGQVSAVLQRQEQFLGNCSGTVSIQTIVRSCDWKHSIAWYSYPSKTNILFSSGKEQHILALAPLTQYERATYLNRRRETLRFSSAWVWIWLSLCHLLAVTQPLCAPISSSTTWRVVVISRDTAAMLKWDPCTGFRTVPRTDNS